MKPRIGITAWRRDLPTFLGDRTDLYTLGLEYVDAIVQAGGIPLIVPHAGDAEGVLDALDGLMMSGGDDVHPESYGEPLTDSSHGTSIDADRWEIALVRAAARRHMPVLAICRGMQIMSVAFGGKLTQHLEQVEGHPDYAGMSAEDILAHRHDVTLRPGCDLALVYGEFTRQVNTIHHQAVVDAGDLDVAGTGTGEVIEAVQARNGWTAWGVQWHPEKMTYDHREERLFAAFIEKARGYAVLSEPVATR